MKTEGLIHEMYFVEEKEPTEIAEELGITKQAVYKTLKKFPEYILEKEKRKIENQKKYIVRHEEYKKNWMKEKRQGEKDFRNRIIDYFFTNLSKLDFLYDFTEEKIALHFNIPLHEVYDVLSRDKRYQEIEKIREISAEAQMARLHQLELNATVKRRRISEQLIFESCRSAYEYDSKNERFIFIEKFGQKPRDLKKYYKVHIQMTITDELKNKIEEEKRTSQVEKEVIEKEE
jgi:predicted DNA-binding protein YlxM (UPF0122 family)